MGHKMATRVVTFRLPEDLIQAITSQASATGKCKTAVVIDALKQVLELPRSTASPALIKKPQEQQAALREGVPGLNQSLVELNRGTLSYNSVNRIEESNHDTVAGQAFLDDVLLPPQQVSQAQSINVSGDVTDTNHVISQESKSAEEQHGGVHQALQVLAAKVEQRARMLEQVLSASVDHVCMYDRLGRYTYANRAFMQSFGLEQSELYGKTWQQLGLPADTMKPFEAKRQIAFATGQSIAEEISLPTVNGVRDYEYILSPINTPDGSIEAVVYTARDITERKQAEELLRESEKNYRNLFEWAHDSIFITDSSTQVLLDVNEHGARRLGYTRKQLLSLPAEVFSPPMDPEHRADILQHLWKTGSVTFEHVHQCKQGSQMPVEISSRVVEYGGQLAIQSFVRDITQRKQAEERADLYWAIIAQYSEAMAILDLKGRYIQQNPAYSLLLGYSDDELVKLTAAFHLGEEVFALIRKELLNNGRFCGQVTSYTKSGHLLTLELETFVVCNDAGEPIYYVETKRNLTDYKPF